MLCIADFSLEGGGSERGVFYFQSRMAEEIPFDFLGRYLELVREAGIRVVIYFNVHWLHESFGSQHIDWLQRRIDGSIIDDVYGMGMCP